MPKHLAHAAPFGARHEPFVKLARTVGSAPKSCFECGPLFASKSGSILASTEGNEGRGTDDRYFVEDIVPVQDDDRVMTRHQPDPLPVPVEADDVRVIE
jgi:hypothetical protein